MLLDYFSLAWKSLTHKRLRSWLTILGIFIGVMAVVALISLGNGLKAAINSQFGLSSTELITVQAGGLSGYGPPGTGVVKPLTTDDIKAIEKINGVDVVVRRNLPTGKLEFNDKVGFGYGINIPSGEKRKVAYDIVDIEPLEGRLLRDGDTNKVMLGYNFIKDTNGFDKAIKVGDTVKVQDKKFQVVGILKKKGSFIFDNLVYFQEDELNDLFDLGDKVDVIGVKVKDKSLVEPVSKDIEKLLRKRRDVKEGEEDFEVSTPEQALQNVNSVLTGVQIFIIIIASISIIVGAIGIVNTMTTSVLERKREIGIMKSIGSRNSDIFYQFLIESGLMGLVGGIVGTIFGITIGYFGTKGINSFVGAGVSPEINIFLIIFTLIGSFTIGSVAGIIPAMKAARQNPVDALRG